MTRGKLSAICLILLFSASLMFVGTTITGTSMTDVETFDDEDNQVEDFAKENQIEYTPTFANDGMNSLNYNGLVPGDIIVLGTAGTFFDYLIPGEFSHTEIFCGFVQSGQYIWDRDNHEWMAASTPYVIHSTKSDNAGNGLGYSTWLTGVNEHADTAVALRVSGVNNAQRQQAVDWCKSKLAGGTDGNPVGPNYDWGWTSKQIDCTNRLSGVDGWYCSELAWAAYKDLFGIDLDPDGNSWSWTTAYGISPSDLYEDSNTYVITTSDWSAEDCYYVEINLVGVYYETDSDPWPKGAGEMYMKWYVGDGWGGSGYVTKSFHGITKRNGRGYIYWKKTMASVLIPKTHPLKINVQAWEDDSWPDRDDQFPAFNYWSDSMLDFVNTGWWWWYYLDVGSCRYCIEFSISTSPIGTSPNGL